MIKYPSGVKAQPIKKKHEKKQGVELSISASNRGMNLENDINLSNEYYRDHDICVITKRPTPVNIVKVDYSHGARITDAYFESNLRQTITAFIKDAISILKPKILKTKLHFL